MTEQQADAAVLQVQGLVTQFRTLDGTVHAVDGVNLSVHRGEIVGLVGESGCGKSVTAFSILRLIEKPGQIAAGRVLLDGQDLLALSEAEMAAMRGNRISMIFQQPTTCLNYVHRVGAQISEVFEVHECLSKDDGLKRAVDLMRAVGIPEPQRRARAYPHELSGGMAQRVMIAMALACRPQVLLADEPTTALDVTIQAQILDLIRNLREQTNTAVILITHDLGIVAEMCQRVYVMYAGQIVEEANVQALFGQPLHPYTRGLLGAIPVFGQRRERLSTIPGKVPRLIDVPRGCRFASRCRERLERNLEICKNEAPELLEVEPGRRARCWLYSRQGDV
ncbi:MAG: ABC transporter ATP-binding protein [Chloroflexi bacterium]|nr:ABC transporter ATP-binding protein [Chloroflexota bacterium]